MDKTSRVRRSVTVGPLPDLAAGTLRLVERDDLEILVANCGVTIHAIENRCSHDDGPPVETFPVRLEDGEILLEVE